MDINKFRRSVRRFSSQEITEAEWKYIEEVAYHSPTSMNWEPWRVAILTREQLTKLTQKEVLFNNRRFNSADKAMIFLSPTEEMWNEGSFIKEAVRRTVFNTAKMENPNIKIEDIPEEQIEKGYQYWTGTEEARKNYSVEWARRQPYIAVGMVLYASASKKIDTLVVEGLNKEGLQEFLIKEGLSADGWEPVVGVMFGFRDKDLEIESTERKPWDYKFFKK